MEGSMKNFSFRLITFLIFLLLVQTEIRAAGALDPTFGTKGIVATTMNSQPQAKAVLIQPDGKIVVVGDAAPTPGAKRDVAYARYNADGTLDSTFAFGGRAFVSISNDNDFVNGAALQPDGKIIIVGSMEPTSGSTNTDFLIIRIDINGSLDSQFGNLGFVTINQSSTDFFNAVAVHPDGKIVAVGGTSQNNGEAAILRFNQNGTLDSSFGVGGLMFKNYPNLTREAFQTVTIQPNAPPVGRILAGGQGISSVPHLFNLSFLSSLYYSNGSDCQDFGTQCAVFFGSGGTTPSLDTEVLSDGKILTVSDGTRRFLSSGAIDTSFSGGDFGSELAVLSDGKFIIGGSIFTNFNAEVFTKNGRFIGKARNLVANDIAVQPDNKIVFINSTETDFVVTRLISITSQATRLADYDDDDKTDLAFLRPSNSSLNVLQSGGNSVSYNSGEAEGAIRRVIPERFDNLLFFPFIYWRTDPNTQPAQGFFCGSDGANRQCSPWGISGDIPVGGDYDGDTVTDLTVFRPSEGNWYFFQSSNKQSATAKWGTNGDKPVPADYDYDGKTDLAIYRPSTGTWWINRSSDNSYFTIPFGIASDIPLTGDFDGDGRADFTVYRASEGNWYQLLTKEGFRVVRFGLPTDIPVPGDYDGDGRHDVAVFRNGLWYLLQSTEGFKVVQWGNATDTPVAVRYDQ
jgi:uncharacterized delta-60 repeat protein